MCDFVELADTLTNSADEKKYKNTHQLPHNKAQSSQFRQMGTLPRDMDHLTSNIIDPFIKIHGYFISRFIRNLNGRKQCYAVAMYMTT